MMARLRVLALIAFIRMECFSCFSTTKSTLMYLIQRLYGNHNNAFLGNILPLYWLF